MAAQALEELRKKTLAVFARLAQLRRDGSEDDRDRLNPSLLDEVSRKIDAARQAAVAADLPGKSEIRQALSLASVILMLERSYCGASSDNFTFFQTVSRQNVPQLLDYASLSWEAVGLDEATVRAVTRKLDRHDATQAEKVGEVVAFRLDIAKGTAALLKKWASQPSPDPGDSGDRAAFLTAVAKELDCYATPPAATLPIPNPLLKNSLKE